MKKFRIIWQQTTTEISIPIEAQNEEEAKKIWFEDDRPLTLRDRTSPGVKVEELDDKGHPINRV